MIFSLRAWPLALSPRLLVLAGGRVRIHASKYPVLGSAASPQLVAVMFDYTCAVCRANHALLNEAVSRYRAQLSFVMVPTPLDPACNAAIERVQPEHVHSCLYARYALAVWRAAPEKFAVFDAGLMTGGEAPPSHSPKRLRPNR